MKRKKFNTIFTVVGVIAILLALLNIVTSTVLINHSATLVAILVIFVVSLAFWIVIGIDWPSLLCLLALMLVPDLSANEIISLAFGNSTFIFLLFTFILTYALGQTSMIQRITAYVLHHPWAQVNATRFIFAFLGVILALSAILSPTILFMIIFPLFEEICQQFHLDKSDKRSGQLLFAILSTIAIGTAMTPINHVFAITAIGLFESAFSQSITYGQYLLFAVPIGLVTFMIVCLSLYYMLQFRLDDAYLNQVASLKQLPQVTRKEKIVAAVFLGVIILWLFPELFKWLMPSVALYIKQLGLAFPPLLGVVILSMLTIENESALDLPTALQKGVHWPSLLLVAATLTLGNVLVKEEIGLIQWLNAVLSPVVANLSIGVIFIIIIIWAAVQTNLSSNLVTVSVVTSFVITMSQTYEVNQAAVAMMCASVGYMASVALMTPPAMPYVAISVGSGWLTSKQALQYGAFIVSVSVLLCWSMGMLFGSYIF